MGKSLKMSKLVNVSCARMGAFLLLCGMSHGAGAQQTSTTSPAHRQARASTSGSSPTNQTNAAQQLVDEAVAVVNKMKSDPKLATLMKQAKGIYIVPKFGRGALIAGAKGGVGLATFRQDDKWSDPAFFDFGAISLGPQAGVSGGPIAFLLMKPNAVRSFRTGNNFALNADAGLSIFTYSSDVQASWGKGDIFMWSDNPGLYAGATVSVSDIAWDTENNHAYYGDDPTVAKILSGSAKNAASDELKNALPS
jgi:SH3 domain-containing YSC84-like protein 1